MLIDVSYFAQAAVATGCSSEQFDVENLGELLQEIHARHGSSIDQLICNAEGTVVPWILIDLNGEAIRTKDHALHEGDHVRFLSPISGG